MSQFFFPNSLSRPLAPVVTVEETEVENFRFYRLLPFYCNEKNIFANRKVVNSPI